MSSVTPSLMTDRLVLAPLRVEDAEEMVDVFADPSLYAFIGGEPPNLDDIRDRFMRWTHGSPRSDEDWHNWIVRLRDGTAIGNLQATVLGAGREADIAWLIGTAWQGNGH